MTYAIITAEHLRHLCEEEAQKLCERWVGELADGLRIRLEIAPYGGYAMEQRDVALTCMRYVDHRGGPGLLKYTLDAMVDDALRALQQGPQEASDAQ